MAEDVRRYAAWMREQAQTNIGHLYPPIVVSSRMKTSRPDLDLVVGSKFTPIAWLWARTVNCPNPACGRETPLLLLLSSKPGRETYIVPKIENGKIRIPVSRIQPSNLGDVKKGYKRGTSGIFERAFCGTATTRDYTADRATSLVGLGVMPTAIVCESSSGRIYFSPEDYPFPDQIPKVDSLGLSIELAANPRDVR